MKIHEHQAKEIFEQYDIPTPKGKVFFYPNDVYHFQKELGKKVVVKAQVHVGGRGKSGGIKMADNPDDAREMAKRIIGMIINSFIAYFLNSYYSGKMIGYPTLIQLKDLFPSFCLAISMGLIIFIPTLFIDIKPLVLFLLQMLSAIIIVISASEIFKLAEYIEIKKIILSKVKNLRK